MNHRTLVRSHGVLPLLLTAAAIAQSEDAEHAAREAAFAEQMTGCKMIGHFTVDGSGKPPRAESYTIKRAQKLRDEKWKFDATIQYDDKNVTLPIGVDVLWAGDTPTIQVTKLGIPMLGTYSARVVIHGDRYAGLWSGKDYGGHMYGKLERAPAPAAPQDGVGNWASWRGPKGSGEAPNSNPPTTWSEELNIRWKVALPGKGHSTPISWGDRLYLMTAVETDKAGEAPKLPPLQPRQGQGGNRQRPGRPPRRRGGNRRGPEPLTKFYDFRVMALDRKDGSVVWSQSVNSVVPHEPGHRTGSQASGSPVTDGKYLFANFGSRGLHCLDLEGNVKWSKEFGLMRTRNEFGEGTSPAIHGDYVVMNWDHELDSFIAAFDKHTGEELWRKSRDEVTSWSTPVIVEVDGKPQVIINATGASRGYDLATGDVVWSTKGMTVNTIPTPIVNDGVAYLMSGFRGAMLQAVELAGAKGDVTESKHMLWQHNRSTSYVPSALLYGSNLYFLRSNTSTLTCLDAKTGEPRYEGQRIPGLRTIYSSPIGAAGHVYFTSREGKTVVIKAGDTFEEVATNELEDAFDASMVVLGDAIYLRGHEHLYCIGKQ
ncbi:MAG: PQQ-binding-like beta-propeller repeat protein [bacterium]|nr:PQQ-binding-like beta-propeller repeat protein [bacterium]